MAQYIGYMPVLSTTLFISKILFSVARITKDNPITTMQTNPNPEQSSETPRTDAEVCHPDLARKRQQFIVSANCARQLELELNAKEKECRELKDTLEWLSQQHQQSGDKLLTLVDWYKQQIHQLLLLSAQNEKLREALECYSELGTLNPHPAREALSLPPSTILAERDKVLLDEIARLKNELAKLVP